MRKTSLTGNHGQTGIDAIFVKDGQYFIVEAKYGTATLTPANQATRLAKQMSDDWIKTDNRILRAIGGDNTLADNIQRNYRRLLAKIAPDGTIVYRELDGMANEIGNFIP